MRKLTQEEEIKQRSIKPAFYYINHKYLYLYLLIDSTKQTNNKKLMPTKKSTPSKIRFPFDVAYGKPIKKHTEHVKREITHVFGRLSFGIKSSTLAVNVSAQQKLLSNPNVNNIKKNMADNALAAPPNVGIADAITIKAKGLVYTCVKGEWDDREV